MPCADRMGSAQGCQYLSSEQAATQTANSATFRSADSHDSIAVFGEQSILQSLESFVGDGRASSSSAQAPRSPTSQTREQGVFAFRTPPVPWDVLRGRGSGFEAVPRPQISDLHDQAGHCAEEVYRIRFFNFNMANSSNFASVSDLQGPGGRGRFLDVLKEPFADGEPPDIAFATLVETRLNMTDWVQEYLRKHADSLHLHSVLAQNARREGGQRTHSKFRKWMEGLAASYNGNLKSMLAFRSNNFEEDKAGVLFGRLTEAKVAGIPVPNPKKAFMGRSITTQHQIAPGRNLRFCFVSAHFPIALLAKALEEGDHHTGKIAMVHTLRKVLKKASRKGLVDDSTVFFVQGDLNSRTVLPDDEGVDPWDVLLEVLADDAMQAAVQAELTVPPGQWRELPAESGNLEVNRLPVTYKFHEQAKGRGVDSSSGGLTIGEVIRSSRERSPMNDSEGMRQNDLQGQNVESVKSFATNATFNAIYKKAMSNVGDAQLEDWGVVFKKHDFRAFRFPACADRVIYWAPDSLADRMSWELPRRGYEVNYGQYGSDHKPVTLEAVLRLTRTPVRRSSKASRDGLMPNSSLISDRASSVSESLAVFDVMAQDSDCDSDREVDKRQGYRFAGDHY